MGEGEEEGGGGSASAGVCVAKRRGPVKFDMGIRERIRDADAGLRATYLEPRVSPKKHGFVCETGLTWRSRYAVTSEERGNESQWASEERPEFSSPPSFHFRPCVPRSTFHVPRSASRPRKERPMDARLPFPGEL